MNKVIIEKRHTLEDEIKSLDVKMVEVEEKVLGFKEKMRLLEEYLVNGFELQVKDATGLEVMGKFLKVEKLTKELVDAVVERGVVGKGKAVEVRLCVK